ncbi:MAG: DUF2093 domain-containing protein [Pseudomonadota bacterium]|nr:DUF2093 domain-containing protein [Pseudomonadota bacterium]
MEKEAKLIYGDGTFKISESGTYVVCAKTKKRIPINELKYWSVQRQEAYYDAESSLKAKIEND